MAGMTRMGNNGQAGMVAPAAHPAMTEPPYACEVADDLDLWPGAGRALLAELAAVRGRIALVDADAPSDADRLVGRLQDDLHLAVARLGQVLSDRQEPPATEEISQACGDATLISDIDLLFWPALPTGALSFLTARARRTPTIALWPGKIAGGRATYSALGRPDYTDVAIRNAVVLRPRATSFPDEVPFRIERILP